MDQFKKQTFQFIRKTLLEVEGLTKEEQIQHIQKSCENQPELIPKLLNMLDIGESEFAKSMERPLIYSHFPDIDTQPSTDVDSLPVGTIISHYEITGLIGTGGMGHVYAAQQKYPAERTVALKLLKSTPNQQLLLTETQILARLNHPNIATLFEIDTTTDGQYFIAMEFIEGEDIINWCKNHKYSISETIRLFQQLCTGISFAHEQEIIHCDIKPSNVLVTFIDGVATVKIIDFGISQSQNQTRSLHEISGTPAYLAPEVLNSKGAWSSDARRDVYSLGILLKKLLPETNSIDLQAIFNKATNVEIENRYQSVAKLNQDLNRFLNKQTVSAYKSGIRHSSRLFVQRHSTWFFVFAVVLILSLTSAYFAQRKQARIATEQAEAAKLAQKEAEEMSAFLTDLFNVANPERNKQDISAVELLDKARDQLLEMEAPGLSEARFMHTIGSIYTRMEHLQDAKAMISKSMSIKAESLPENHTEIIAANSQLGLVYKKLGDTEKAEVLLSKALNELKKQNEPNQDQLAYAHNHLGNLYTQVRKFNQAIDQHLAAIEIRKKLPDSHLLADSYNNLGVIYTNIQNLDEAAKNYHLALELYRNNYEDGHPYINLTQHNLAYIEEQRFNWDTAEQLKRDVIASWKKIYDKDHTKLVAVQRNLGLFYDRRMKFDQAFEVYDELIDTFESIGNKEQMAKYVSYKAMALNHSEQFDKAIIEHEKAIDLVHGIAFTEKKLFAVIHNRYAEALFKSNDFQGAIKALETSLADLESKYDLGNENRLYTLNVMAGFYSEHGDDNRAIEIYQQVLSYNNPAEVRNQLRMITAHLGLGKIYINQQKHEQSEQEFSIALELNKKFYKEGHKSYAEIYYQLALFNELINNRPEAKNWAQKALNIQLKALPEQHKDILLTKELLQNINQN